MSNQEALIISTAINSIAAANKLFGFENGDVLIVTPVNALIVLFAITLVTFIAGIFPALKASNMDPIESLRYE